MTNKPLLKLRDKTISITIWPGKSSGYQCKVLKEYKPKDSNEWKKSDSYFPHELERLEKLCADARRWIHEQGTQAETDGGYGRYKAACDDYEKKHSEAKANAYQPQQAQMFDDEDLPF